MTTSVFETAPSPLVTGRGETTVSPRAVEKIAGRAAQEVQGVRTAAVGGGGALQRLRHGAATSAEVDAATADVVLHLDVEYPRSVRAVTDEVRRHVAERVHALTGLEVHGVDIVVERLVTAPPAPPPRVV